MARVPSVLEEILGNLSPVMQADLGANFQLESRVVTPPGLDGLKIVTAAEMNLPRVTRELLLAPYPLVKGSAHDVLQQIIEGHLKPFVRELHRAGDSTTAAWLMATNGALSGTRVE